MKNINIIPTISLFLLFLSSFPSFSQEIATVTKPSWVKEIAVPYEKLDTLKKMNEHGFSQDVYREIQVNLDTKEMFMKVISKTGKDVTRTNQQQIHINYSSKDTDKKIIAISLIKNGKEENITTKLNWNEAENREYVANRLWEAEKHIQFTIDKVSEEDMYAVSSLDKYLRTDVSMEEGILQGVEDSTYIYLRVISKKTLNYQTYNGFPKVNVTKKEGYFEYIAEGIAITPFKGRVPTGFASPSFICLSKYDNFEQVGRSFSNQFIADDTSIKAIDKLYIQLTEDVKNDSIKIQNIINYVQDTLVYQDYGLIRSYQPSWCIQGSRGDCKAKSLIAIELFKRAGIKAVPVLVNSPTYFSQLDSVPSMYSFNHVIVQFTFNDKKILLDPTAFKQTDKIGAYSIDNFKKGLALHKDSIEWIDMPLNKKGKIEIHDIFSDTITRKVILSGEFTERGVNFKEGNSRSLFHSDFLDFEEDNYAIESLRDIAYDQYSKKENLICTTVNKKYYNSVSQDSLVLSQKAFYPDSVERNFYITVIGSGGKRFSFGSGVDSREEDSLYTGLWDLPYINQTTTATYDKDKVYFTQDDFDKFEKEFEIKTDFGYYKCLVEQKNDKFVVRQDIFVSGGLPFDRLNEQEEFKEKIEIHAQEVTKLVFAERIREDEEWRAKKKEENSKKSKLKKKKKK
ncbi:transglutaminase domain-containing protein [Bernardetia sp. OM2101]|uniref:transglutaminase domain-containing protein n=1 Tax=Bernardetia sp. OM2101 TaxID=3344876 RepID=UPI0035CF1189